MIAIEIRPDVVVNLHEGEVKLTFGELYDESTRKEFTDLVNSLLEEQYKTGPTIPDPDHEFAGVLVELFSGQILEEGTPPDHDENTIY